VGVDGVDDCDDVVREGGATTQASHVNILIDPLFLRVLYTGFPIKSVSHAPGIVGTEFVEMEGITNHTRQNVLPLQ
jgi:hypothetical protein